MSKPVRILMYSQDSYGLGHLRRATNLANALVNERSDLSILLVVDSPVAPFFDLQPHIDFVKLPTVVKVGAGVFRPGSLLTSYRLVKAMRSTVNREVLSRFHPDLVLVDHMPGGANRELVPALRLIRALNYSTRVVLGVRDIIDDPAVTCAVWQREGFYDTLRRYYDSVLIYGSPDVFATAAKYQIDGVLPGEGARRAGPNLGRRLVESSQCGGPRREHGGLQHGQRDPPLPEAGHSRAAPRPEPRAADARAHFQRARPRDGDRSAGPVGAAPRHGHHEVAGEPYGAVRNADDAWHQYCQDHTAQLAGSRPGFGQVLAGPARLAGQGQSQRPAVTQPRARCTPRRLERLTTASPPPRIDHQAVYDTDAQHSRIWRRCRRPAQETSRYLGVAVPLGFGFRIPSSTGHRRE